MIFLGLSVGQLFFGPLSDSVGRKPAVFSGLGVYMGGAILSMFAVNFPMMLAGRFLQGIGVSAPRAVTLALVRDQFAGRQMARVMSFVMTVFILVPMLAPSLGQIILQGAGWRAIFGVFLLLAVIALVWFAIRQPETLAPENRAPFTPGRIFKTTKLIVQNRLAFGYTISAGLVSGAFIGYLNSAQQVFQEQYALGDLFCIYFGIVASAIGLASLLNSRLVLHFGMRVLVRSALLITSILSAIVLVSTLLLPEQLPFAVFMAYLMLSFFCVGILFGNLNSLGMEPLGQMAGIGAAIVGSLSTFISVLLGTFIGQTYNGTIVPLVTGLAVLSGLSLLVVGWAEAH